MSHVTNVILTALEYDNEKLHRAIAGYPEAICGYGGEFGPPLNDREENLEKIRVFGGSKFLEADVWVGAFNYLDLPALIEFLRLLPWKNPKSVRLFVQEQDDMCFSQRDIGLAGGV